MQRFVYTVYTHFEYVLRTFLFLFFLLFTMYTATLTTSWVYAVLTIVLFITVTASFIWRETSSVVSISYYLVLGSSFRAVFDYGLIALPYPVILSLLLVVYTVRTNPRFLSVHERAVDTETKLVVENLGYTAFSSWFTMKK